MALPGTSRTSLARRELKTATSVGEGGSGKWIFIPPFDPPDRGTALKVGDISVTTEVILWNKKRHSSRGAAIFQGQSR